MKRIFTLLVVVAVALTASAQLIVPGNQEAPEVDGFLDEAVWELGEWEAVALDKEANTTFDAAGKFKMAATAEGAAILIAVQVEDATPNNDAELIDKSYERDCVEIFFDMDPAKELENGQYENGVWQLRQQREAEEGAYTDGNFGKEGGGDNWNIDPLKNDENFAVITESGASEYTQEWFLPTATLAQGAAFDGTNFNFEIAIADNTTGEAGGRTQQIFWKEASDNQWKDTRTFSAVQIDHTVSKTALENAAKAFVHNNVLNVTGVNGAVKVFDLTGSMVKSANVNGSGSIDISDIKNGLYIVKASNLSAKIVK